MGADMDATPTAYVCRVHPNVRRLGPGTCPKCNGELVARPERRGLRRMATLPVALSLLAMVLILAGAVWLLR